MRPGLAAIFAIALGSACTGPTEAAPAVKPKGPSSEKVDKMFAAMRDGTYWSLGPGFGFPDVGWEDVPALLARAEEERPLATFPTNPLSSFARPSCREGLVALWLVEGVRKGGVRPLNRRSPAPEDRAGARRRNSRRRPGVPELV